MTNPIQWCKKISLEEYNEESNSHTKNEVKKLLDTINECNNVKEVFKSPISSPSSPLSSPSLKYDPESIIGKLLIRNERLQEKIGECKVIIKVNDVKILQLENQEYKQRLQLETKNICQEQLENELKKVSYSSKLYENTYSRVSLELKKQISIKNTYKTLSIMMGLLLTGTHLYIRYFTQYYSFLTDDDDDYQTIIL